MEFIAAHWLLWLATATFCAIAFAVNSLLVTYGTAIDVGLLAFRASKIKKGELPKTREEWVDGAVSLGKEQATSYVKGRLLAKIRKVFFSVFVFGLGVICTFLFAISLIINLIQYVLKLI